MPNNVPKADNQDPNDIFPPHEPLAENLLLQLELAEGHNRQKAEGQRYWLRFYAIGITTVLMGGLGVSLYYVMNWFMFRGYLAEFSSLYIVVYVVPISSLTILALAIMASAFRGHHKSDDTSRKGVSIN